MAVAGAPRARYLKTRGRLRCLDSSHEHAGLVLLEHEGPEPEVELEDGSAVKLEALAADCRLFWRLRRAPRPARATALHAACAEGAGTDALGSLLRGALAARRPCVSAPDAVLAALLARDEEGRTPLGAALASGKKDASIWVLDQLANASSGAVGDGVAWPDADFDSVCLRAASRKANEAEAELRRWQRSDRRADADAANEAAVADRGGAAPRLATLVAGAGACARDLAGAKIASLWSRHTPPLLCADRARKALAELGVAPSALERLKKPDAETLRSRISLEAIKRVVEMLPAPLKRASSAVTEWGADQMRTRARVERCLLLFHAPPQVADALETAGETPDPPDAVVPGTILREVRAYWSEHGSATEDGGGQFHAFLELWRARPAEVLAAVDSGRRALAWLRRLAAARVLDVIAGHKDGDGGGEDETKLAFSLASKARDRSTKTAELEAALEEAQTALGHASRGSQRLAEARRQTPRRRPAASRKLRSVDLVHRREWLSLLGAPEQALGDRRLAVLRSAVVEACLETAKLLRSDDADDAEATVDVLEGVMEPLDYAWSRKYNGGSVPEDPAVTSAAERLLAAMRAVDASVARAKAAADPSLLETLKKAALKCEAAQYDARTLGGTDSPFRNVADAAADWVTAAARTAAHPLVAPEPIENCLDDALRTLGDDDAVLPRLLTALGAKAASELAVKPAADDACALTRCCVEWAPRTLAALLRAAAGHGVGGQVAAFAPRPEGAPSPLIAALRAAPACKEARGSKASARDRQARLALKALVAADPSAAADDGAALKLACEKGYLDVAAALLAVGGVLAEEPDGLSPMHVACEAGDHELAARLLAAAARTGGFAGVRAQLLAAWDPAAPEEKKSSKLAASPSSEMLRRLSVARVAKAETTSAAIYPVHYAVRSGSPKCVELCIDALRDPETASPTPLDDEDDGPRQYRDAPLGLSLLHEAAYHRQPACLALLLRSGGFDPNQRLAFAPAGREATTPLEIAVARNATACVSLLLRAGATPCLEDALKGAKRGLGASAAAVLTRLLSDRVDLAVDAPLDSKSGETMLHAACRLGRADFANLLLSWGASSAATDAEGATPLHYSVAAGHAAATRALADTCADYDSRAGVLQWAFRRNAWKRRRARYAAEEEAAASLNAIWPPPPTTVPAA